MVAGGEETACGIEGVAVATRVVTTVCVARFREGTLAAVTTIFDSRPVGGFWTI
jgi:hypothetical protein